MDEYQRMAEEGRMEAFQVQIDRLKAEIAHKDQVLSLLEGVVETYKDAWKESMGALIIAVRELAARTPIPPQRKDESRDKPQSPIDHLITEGIL